PLRGHKPAILWSERRKCQHALRGFHQIEPARLVAMQQRHEIRFAFGKAEAAHEPCTLLAALRRRDSLLIRALFSHELELTEPLSEPAQIFAGAMIAG